ncbi:benzoate/H(+) symporter BenE family transporter [Anaerobacillus sp. MEB173]|uniref:benzoate/H(+) symporter BenE family transporter n=1 Tax=Anaerobacillus sp. MEB173 TaxID=3383345 RepID=UPI003F8EEF77
MSLKDSGSLKKNIMNNTKSLRNNLDIKTVGTGTVAAVICCTGPILIVITAAQNGNLLPEQTVSWLFGIYFIGGLIGIILPLLLGMPIAGAYSIPSAVLMTQAITQFSFEQVIGAYLIAGLLIFLIGLFGWFQTLLDWLPAEIVMAMIAGSMIHFATDMIQSIFVFPILGGAIVLSYFFFAKYLRAIPPIVGALFVGLALFPFFGHSLSVPDLTFHFPSIWLPDFSFGAVLAISIPITVMLLGTEGAQGISVLKSAGYKPPVNLITMVNGLGTMFAGIFGGHSANIGGIMSALCSSNEVGPMDKRYVAAFVSGVWMCIFGLFASISLALILLLPLAFIKLIAGLALINVLLSSFQRSFSGGQFQMGAFFSLVIAMSGINFYGISSTFWALAGGWCISWFLEKHDFKKRISTSKSTLSNSA